MSQVTKKKLDRERTKMESWNVSEAKKILQGGKRIKTFGRMSGK